jgi:hypothetical protein
LLAPTRKICNLIFSNKSNLTSEGLTADKKLKAWQVQVRDYVNRQYHKEIRKTSAWLILFILIAHCQSWDCIHRSLD